jgi:DNA helicase-2/ATP-dependent DNA helicase PcrA
MTIPLTEEQQQVVNHPRGAHARVCAVAGSGKTSTMVARVKHLVKCDHVNPEHICVLMFNKLARHQFEEKLKQELSPELCPAVNTFHSFASRIINRTINAGFMQQISEYWIEDKEEQVRRTVHTAIRNLAISRMIVDDRVDPDDAIECIGLWKASLIPPERAGHQVNSSLPLVYAEYERIRIAANALSFDDFIPFAISILESEPSIRRQYVGQFETIIVDEYQDVNLGQQTMVQLLAASRADIMAVGDDDQTIYEWRGARSSYFTEQFAQVFSNKPTKDYVLSYSFRFGPLLAQCAHNVIAHNKTRTPKTVSAYWDDEAEIEVFCAEPEQPTAADEALTRQVQALTNKEIEPQKTESEGTKAKDIIVLARLFYQLNGLEAQFLINKVPYVVEGQKPFFKRRENVVLFNYLHLATRLREPADDKTKELLLAIANVPNRYLTKAMLRQFLQSTMLPTLDHIMAFLAYDPMTPAIAKQREKVEDLYTVLVRLHELITAPTPISAGDALRWLIRRLDLTYHYDNYYGKGESSEERKGAIAAVSRFADQIGKDVPGFLAYLATLDTTQGKPQEELIVMTTIFREKGREYPYVVLPSCVEGMMPFLAGSGNPVYDTLTQVEEPPNTSLIENERRLFYVAITRAKKAVYVGTVHTSGNDYRQGKSGAPTASRFIEEMQLGPTRTAIQSKQVRLGSAC